jgi:hypothetical protein
MSDVFLSYKRENSSKVQYLIDGFRGAGLNVWWDQDIAPDAPWEATIERELSAAKVVIVCWSPASVASENVKAEARRARTQGRLIQVFVESCDPPLFFGERQGVDLYAWRGDTSDPRYQAVLRAARAVMEGKRPPEGVGYASRRRKPWAALAAGFALLSTVLGFVANLGGARDAVCSLAALEKTCLGTGIARDEPSTADARNALLARVVGVWGNQANADEPACATTIRYVLEQRGGEDVVIARSEGFESVGRVLSAEGGAIFTRAISPPEEAGSQWQLEPEPDLLTLTDRNGVKTPLVRCGP